MNEPGSATQSEKSTANFPIVVLGASAGGLEALNAFFKGVKEEVGCAYLVVTHHKSDRRSMLPELLARSSGKTALEIANGMKIEPNCIYTNPPGEWFTAVENETFRLYGAEEAIKYTLKNSEVGQAATKVYHPIDFTFQQLAQEIGDRIIAVVLSGSGSDGSLGLKAVKVEDGLIVVEQPALAEFRSMPENAVATGLVDLVLPPEEMGAQLSRYLHQGKGRKLSETVEELVSKDGLRRICALLLAQTGNDFSSYKSNTIQRRVAKRMALLNYEKVEDYLQHLSGDEEEINHLFRELLIRVTRFFRDPEIWDFFRNDLFPRLLRNHDQPGGFRVWVAGCATGDEAYSIAILLSEVLREIGVSMKFQIFASDLDADAIAIARRGEYSAGIINEVPEPLLSRYFSYTDDHYRINSSIRERIVFAPHNLIKDPPFTHIDLISCRNLLIYLKPDMQADLLLMFHMALRGKGTLVLGPSETAGETSEAFRTVNAKWKIFERNPGILLNRTPMHQLRSLRASDTPANSPQRGVPNRRTQRENFLAESVHKVLAQKFAPVAVVMNERGDIYYLHGKADRFLELGEGRPRYNMFEMGRGNLPNELPSLLRSAKASEGEIIERNAKIDRSNNQRVRISVEKLETPESLRGLFLVVFHDTGDEAKGASASQKPETEQTEKEPVSHVIELERDLEQSREAYQALLEQVETQNAELMSANEELQSTNEELQSSNEELETSKEETHSLYEELSSINAELVEKVNNLTDANDDMSNLLNSTAMGILYLDNELKLKRFTDKAKDIIAVRESDEGRPVSELAIQLADENFLEDAESVLSTLQGMEKTVKTLSGHRYLMKLLPYRTRGNVVDGLICTFVDIDEVISV